MMMGGMPKLTLNSGSGTAAMKFSKGERRRVALCRLLLASPDILLLDEPTNHLDALSVAWLERFLADFKGTVVAVTHDRYFLDNVAGWILELDRGAGIPFEGNYSGKCFSWVGTVVAVTHARYFLDNVAGWILELVRGAGIHFEGNYSVTHDRYFLDNVAGWILELDRGAGIPFEGNYSGKCFSWFKGTVVAVTHDRYFLDNVAGWILGLDRGAGIPLEGNYSGKFFTGNDL
eukprot:gene3247-13270_t